MRKLDIVKLSSSACLAALVALGAPRAARADDVKITEEARTHFAAGVALLKDPKEPRYEEAYREFKAAYAASPSYKILGNLGLSAMKIERDAEAIWAFEKYLKEAGPELTPAERQQYERDLLTLKTGVVQVTLESNPPGATITDVRVPVQGDEVHNSYGEAMSPMTLGLRRGHHIITARLPGYLDATWEFEASGEKLPPHTFEMVKPAPQEAQVVRERPVPTVAYVTGGVTIGLLLTGTFFGIRALQKHNDFVKLNDGTHVADADSVRSEGQTLNTITDVVLGGAVVAAGVTAYFVLTRPTVEKPVATASLVPRVAPTWSPHGGGATALWRF